MIHRPFLAVDKEWWKTLSGLYSTYKAVESNFYRFMFILKCKKTLFWYLVFKDELDNNNIIIIMSESSSRRVRTMTFLVPVEISLISSLQNLHSAALIKSSYWLHTVDLTLAETNYLFGTPRSQL